jgi:DNA-binding MurR/RpiR family transcriptional regulator
VQVVGGASVQERLRANAPRLRGAAERIVSVIQAAPGAVLGMTVSDLAIRSETSVGSVVRFAQDLGFRGFQDLKIQLAGDLSAAPPEGDEQPLPARVFTESASALKQAAGALDEGAFHKVVGLLLGSTRILVSGVGTSQPIAVDAAYRLQLAGLPTFYLDDTHRQHVAATLLTRGDLCLTVSHTGQTQETLTVTRAAREAGATTVAISSFAHSPLAQICDVVLVAGSAETGYRLEAMTSRFLHLAVIDALYVAVAEAQPERARTAQERALAALAEHRL